MPSKHACSPGAVADFPYATSQNLSYEQTQKRCQNWAVTWDFQQFSMCDQQNLRSAFAYAQSDQSFS